MTLKIDHRATFLSQYAGMKRSLDMFRAMERTVEGSPWHREDNVLVHTDMVVEQYMRLTDQAKLNNPCHLDEPEDTHQWGRLDYLGAIACAFHDVGKPPAEREKWSESRGTYRGYGGHELLSARMFESYSVDRSPMFTADETFFISWMIEHHLFYAATDDRRAQMAQTLRKHFGKESGPIFCRVLLADQFGRLSDNPNKDQEAIAFVTKFIETMQEVDMTDQTYPEQPTLYMPIAPSGAGKSTFLRMLKEEKPNIVSFSLDALRHEFYHPTDYKVAYDKAVADKSFEARANARFHKDLKEAFVNKHDIYIDNTNLSAKRRKMYLTAAKKLGFRTIAVMMPVALETLLERQKTRGDKQVPEFAVRQHYNALQTPMIGEFDEIITSRHNMQVKQ